jgi:hypothetical protein
MAFYGCGGLREVIIPDSVTEIGNSAFYWCKNLLEVVIPDTVTSIGDDAFDEVLSIRYNGSESSLTAWGARCYNGYMDNDGLMYSDSNMTYLVVYTGSAQEVIIPDRVTYMYDVFRNISGVVKVTIPDSVTHIESNAFFGCDDLTTIYYNGSVTGAPWGAPNATVQTY